MYCRCNNEFEWLMEMFKGKCFFDWEDVAEFIDGDLLKLRYMKKRFGYLFYDEQNYIKKINGRDVIFVNKKDEYVCRKPEELISYGIDENKPIKEKHYLNNSIFMEDGECFEIKFLDEIDRGDPFITTEEKRKIKM